MERALFKRRSCLSKNLIAARIGWLASCEVSWDILGRANGPWGNQCIAAVQRKLLLLESKNGSGQWSAFGEKCLIVRLTIQFQTKKWTAVLLSNLSCGSTTRKSLNRIPSPLKSSHIVDHCCILQLTAATMSSCPPPHHVGFHSSTSTYKAGGKLVLCRDGIWGELKYAEHAS